MITRRVSIVSLLLGAALTACGGQGVAAADAVAAGRFGAMVALQGPTIVEVPLADALAEPKLLDSGLFETAQVFFG